MTMTENSQKPAVSGFWDLMRDCIPKDNAEQVPDTFFLQSALAEPSHAARVVEIHARDSRRPLTSNAVRTGYEGAWEDVTLNGSSHLNLGTDTIPLIAEFGVFERVAEPKQLASEIARVLAPGGQLVGSVSNLEPYNELSLWNFSALGFRAILEEAGLHVVAVRPGIDALALTLYWAYGESEVHRRHFDQQSPLNVEFAKWGRSTGRSAALVNNRALQFCGRFAYRAEKRDSGVPEATEWHRRLGGALAGPIAGDVPGKGVGRGHARRSFALALPEPPDFGRVSRLLRLRRHQPQGGSLKIEAEWDQSIPRELESVGLAGYEAETLACFLAGMRFAPGGWMYDVGANVGIYALLARRYSRRPVVAFEPTPEAAATAHRVSRQNGLQFIVEELALGAEKGTATLYMSDRSDASNSLAPGFRASSASLTVAVETVDGYVARTHRRPGLLKIDTETTEPDVIRGAANTIRAYRPWLILEVLFNRRESDLADALAAHAYRGFRITDTLPWKAEEEIRGDPEYANRNWLFTPQEPPHAFWSAVESWRRAIARCVPPGANPEREDQRAGPFYGWPAGLPVLGTERLP
jgi:FkbM family methyltransferase